VAHLVAVIELLALKDVIGQRNNGEHRQRGQHQLYGELPEQHQQLAGCDCGKPSQQIHGGELRIDSVLGKGTTISFTIPAHQAGSNGEDSEAINEAAE